MKLHLPTLLRIKGHRATSAYGSVARLRGTRAHDLALFGLVAGLSAFGDGPDSLRHSSSRRIRNLVDIARGKNVAERSAAGLDEDLRRAGEVEEELYRRKRTLVSEDRLSGWKM